TSGGLTAARQALAELHERTRGAAVPNTRNLTTKNAVNTNYAVNTKEATA
ncbi:MAG: hypothetical protein HOV83_36860, partial [Catenulispora sp.]|nr:hypothetical protein [Catenulispora sp.]